MTTRYVCVHCGADDSTRCSMLPAEPPRGYTEQQLTRARAVACRVVYYRDRFEATGSYDDEPVSA